MRQRDSTERKRAEEALRLSEEKYRTLVETSHDLIWALDAEGRIAFVNGAARVVYGYEPKEVLGRHFVDFVPPEDARAVAESFRRTVEDGGVIAGIEQRVVRADGRIVTLSTNAVARRDGNGKLLGLTGCSQDITDRKREEEALRESEERFRELAENIHKVFWLLSLETGRLLYVSPAYELIWGRPRDRLYENRMAWMEAVHPEDLSRVIAAMGRQAEAEYNVEYRIVRPDGSMRWIADRGFPVRDAHGHAKRIAGFADDITERKRLEQAVTVREQQLASFFRSATAGLALLDEDLRFLQINETLAEMNGRPVLEHIGRTIREVLPELAPTLEPLYRRVLATGHPVLDLEFAGATPKLPGVRRYWQASFFLVPRSEGASPRFGAVVVEVSERKAAEEELRESELRFRQLAEHLHAIFWLASPDQQEVFYVSPAFDEIFGRSRQEFARDPFVWLTCIHPEDRLRIQAEAEKDTGQAFEREYRIVRPDGTVRWIAAHGFPVRDGCGKIIRLAGIAEDVTEREHAKEGLRTSEAKYRRLYDSMADAFAAVDMAAQFQDANPAFCELVGYSDAELRKLTYRDLTPSKWHVVEAAILRDQVLVRGYSGIYEKEYQRKDGTVIPVEMRTFLLRDDNGQPTGMWAIVREISARKRAEEELRRVSGQLLNVQDEERRRIARELHDSVAQNLSATVLSLGLLEDVIGSQQSSARTLVLDCRSSIEECAQEIRNVAHLLHPPLLDELGLEVALDTYVTSLARRTGLSVRLELDSRVEGISQPAALALFRVVQEALSNVLRHSQSKTASVQFMRARERVVLEVSDQGCGIPPEIIEQLRSGCALLGVGIMGMRERLEQFGGTLELDSSNRGTIVRAILPAPQRPNPGDEDRPQRTAI
jgi:PAS domain S-box-containing protein